MRNLKEIILELLEHIPVDNEELRMKLSNFKDCENSYENWNDVGDILYEHVFSNFYPEISWQSMVEKIWTGDDDQDSLDCSNF